MATAAQYAQWIVENKDKKGTPEFDKVAAAYRLTKGAPEAKQEPAVEKSPEKPEQYQDVQAQKIKDYQEGLKDIPTAELIASDPAYRAAKGAAMPLMGAAQYVGERVLDPAMQFAQENIVNPAREMVGAQPRKAPQPGDWITEQIRTGERLKQGGMEKTGQPQGLIDPYELAGGVVGGSAALKGLPVAKTLIDKMLQSGSVSGLYGASMPTTAEDKDFDVTKLKQMGTATALGGGLPVIGETVRGLGRTVGQVVRPFSKKGITKDTIDLLSQEIGPQRTKVINALSKAKRGETAGQTLARYGVENADDIGASIVRLEKDLAKKGGTGSPLREQYQTQEARRKAVIDAIRKTPETRAAAVTERAAATDPLYKAVEQSTKRVNVQPITSKVDDILAKNPNETGITAPLKTIKSALQKDNSPQSLYSLSKEVKNMMGKTTPGGQKEYNVKVLKDIKDAIDDSIGSVEPAFKQAQKTFAEKSVPINRMDVGETLATKLTPTGKETPGAFIRAAKDAPKTLKQSTGFARYNELEDVLSPQQATGVRKVAKELEQNMRQRDMAGSVEKMLPKLEGTIEMRVPNMLSRPALAANAILRSISKAKTDDYNRVAVELAKDPRLLAAYLKNPPDAKTGEIARQIYNEILPVFSGQAAGMEESR